MKIKFLKANKGDSIHLSFTDTDEIERNILIDGGTGSTYYDNKLRENGALYHLIETIKTNDKKIDLLVLTHIDDDHIGGILRWFSKDKTAFNLIDKVWFNSGKTIADYLKFQKNEELEVTLDIFEDELTSVRQAKKLEDYLIENNIWDKKIIIKGNSEEVNGLKIQILSPTNKKLEKLLTEFKKPKNYFTSGEESDWNISLSDFIKVENSIQYKFDEDDSIPNGSSIAFILTFNEKNYVFLGDSHPADIIESLTDLGFRKDNPLITELLKVSHHGSCRNTNKELLEIIKTDNYIISSDGTSDNLPNKRTFARIANENPNATIHFNYEKLPGFIFANKDRQDFPNLKINSISEYI